MNPRCIKTKFTIKFLKTLKKLSHSNNDNNNRKLKADHQTIKLASDWSLATVVGPRRAWSRALLRRIQRRRSPRVVGQRRIVKAKKIDELRGLVPGGEEMDTSKLLSETMHYIKCLATQVNVMKNMVDLCST